MHLRSLPCSPLPVPAFALTVKAGAARFGRRTPEPHVWPAAPRQIMRGEYHRGVGMSEDQALPLPALIAELRAKADQRGLTLEEAMLAFCDLSKATELLDLDPHNVDYLIFFPSSPPSRSLTIRAELCAELRGKLLSGGLVAYGLPLEAGPLDERKEIPSHFWEGSGLYPSNNRAEDIDGAMIGRLRIKEPVATALLPKAQISPCPSNQKEVGHPMTEAGQISYAYARAWLLENGEDLKAYHGKQADCIRFILDRFSQKEECDPLSESQLKTIVKNASARITEEKGQ